MWINYTKKKKTKKQTNQQVLWVYIISVVLQDLIFVFVSIELKHILSADYSMRPKHAKHNVYVI